MTEQSKTTNATQATAKQDHNVPKAKTSHQASQKGFWQTIKQNKHKIYFVIFCLAWAIIANYLGQFIIAFPMLWLLGDKLNQPGWMLLYYILTYALTLTLVLIVPIAIIRFLRKQQDKTKLNPQVLKRLDKDLTINKDEMGVAKMPSFIDIGLAPIGYIAYLILANILLQFMSIFSWFDAGQDQSVGFSYYVTSLDRIFAMIAVVIIAPVAEELIMRGWLYGKIRSRCGIVMSMFLVSLLFAVLHGQWNVGVSVFALSLVLCSLREITGTIWSGMLLHILSNGIAFYLLYVAI